MERLDGESIGVVGDPDLDGADVVEGVETDFDGHPQLTGVDDRAADAEKRLLGAGEGRHGDGGRQEDYC